jgi:hypothetical protein
MFYEDETGQYKLVPCECCGRPVSWEHVNGVPVETRPKHCAHCQAVANCHKTVVVLAGGVVTTGGDYVDDWTQAEFG